jgi:transposase InsO family protein
VWLLQNRRKATEGLRETGKSGFMEVFHLCSSASSPVSHGSLLSAAKQAVVPTQLGRPIGFVSDRDSAKPKATNRGIVAEFGVEPNFNSSYDYWALSQNGQFYSLSSFFEDRDNSKDTIVYEARIIRTTEALVHCAKLYRSLGAKPSADVEITIVYGGIRERMLSSIEPASLPGLARLVNHSEEQYTRTIRFRLSSLEMKLAELVKSVCEPFFALFDFATFAEWVYLRWVSNVLSRNGV